MTKDKDITEVDILNALRRVKYPGYSRDIVSFGMIKDIVVTNSHITFSINLLSEDVSIGTKIEEEVRKELSKIPDIASADIRIIPKEPAPKESPFAGQKSIPGIKHIIAVASGKGGVGKSTVSVNLALALGDTGDKVGLMDADIYGPSAPMMLGVEEKPTADEEERILPISKYGIKLMSTGLLVGEADPIIWRGPMVMKMVEEFLKNVAWGELDYLVIDLPPGTGDAQLTLVQKVPLSGAIIVTTPQDIALIDAKKGLAMFQKTNVPILGIIENMSYFVCPHCQGKTEIFRYGGGRKTSELFDVPFLGEIPIDPRMPIGGDIGQPIVKAYPDSPVAATFRKIAWEVKRRIESIKI